MARATSIPLIYLLMMMMMGDLEPISQFLAQRNIDDKLPDQQK